jgi:hypothetical protein
MTFKWNHIFKNNKEDVYYSILKLEGDGMEALRQMFPTATADYMNFVIFSTSGIHGHCGTIEEAEAELNSDIRDDDEEIEPSVTFLIVKPRIVTLQYGNCRPQDQDDIDFLKELRKTSKAAMLDCCEIAGEKGLI